MCAIVDANVAHEVFGSKRPEAGEKFFQWITHGSGRLVVGGEVQEELNGSSAGFRSWGREAVLSGRLRIENQVTVNARTDQLRAEETCKSDDEHVIALAQISGARLLYSNDSALQRDFKRKSLIDNPRGKVYSTRENRDLTSGLRRLLGRRDLCQVQKERSR